MSTRADFYVKRGDEMEWCGSIQWSGNETAVPASVTQAVSELDFKEALESMFKNRSDAVKPPERWPWIWESSKLTDFAYIMREDKGGVFISRFNKPAYTIYQYRDYVKLSKKAKKEGRGIVPFDDFMAKVSDYTPQFPKMLSK